MWAVWWHLPKYDAPSYLPYFLSPKLLSCVLPVATLGNGPTFDAWPSNVFLNSVSDLEFWITVWLEQVCVPQLQRVMCGVQLHCTAVFGVSSSQHQTCILFKVYKEGGAFVHWFLCIMLMLSETLSLLCWCNVCMFQQTDYQYWLLSCQLVTV
jgi:hypothetical protein